MPRLHCQPRWKLLMQKTQSCVLIMGQRTWSLLDGTHPIEISTMGILFWWSPMILSLLLCGWEKHNVMLWRMSKMKISKWWGSSGGFQWKKAQIWMHNICMKIVGMANGNVIY
jgi:hypothetical protein